jgi:hypothetical protein
VKVFVVVKKDGSEAVLIGAVKPRIELRHTVTHSPV